jgi:hypothetical protein
MRGAPRLGSRPPCERSGGAPFWLTALRTARRGARERRAQYHRKPLRCQRTTVLGVTTTKGFRPPDHSRRSVTQNGRSREPSRGHGRWACKASNCRRDARFSRMRSAQDRNTPVSQPNKCRKRTNIAAILSVRRKTTKRVSHSRCGRSQFWRMTP